jgi:hypothetical protein
MHAVPVASRVPMVGGTANPVLLFAEVPVPKSTEGRVEWSKRGCQRIVRFPAVPFPLSLQIVLVGDCRVRRTLVCSQHDAVQKATPRRPPLLRELLQVHP